VNQKFKSISKGGDQKEILKRMHCEKKIEKCLIMSEGLARLGKIKCTQTNYSRKNCILTKPFFLEYIFYVHFVTKKCSYVLNLYKNTDFL
jgi:hypothetical protein